MRYLSLILLFVTICFVSCTSDDETCRESTKVVLRIGFFNAENAASASVDSISIIGIPDGNIFYENVKSASKVEIPLNSKSIVSEYAIRFNEQWDTLTVLYHSSTYFVSYACGSVFTHDIDTVLVRGPVSKSLKIPFKLVNTQNVQHLQIYR